MTSPILSWASAKKGIVGMWIVGAGMRYKRVSIGRITIQSLVNNAADDSPAIGIHGPTLADPATRLNY